MRFLVDFWKLRPVDPWSDRKPKIACMCLNGDEKMGKSIRHIRVQ